MTLHDCITVGVDGSDGSAAATRWAAREAALLGLRLRIVHMFIDYVPMLGANAAVYPDGSAESDRVAERIVQAAAREAELLLAPEHIDTVVVRGNRRLGLLQAAADAHLLVLGDEAHPQHHRLPTGSIIAPIATHSPSPVAVVPAGWLLDPARTTVVVGAKSGDSSLGLIRHAMRIAADRAARLVVLHAWEYADGIDALFESYDELPDWEERIRTDLTELVADASPPFSGLDVEVRMVHGQPASVLTDASATAQLLVIGRRAHGRSFGHLGGTGRAVLRESRCPAMVLPARVETMQPFAQSSSYGVNK